MKRGSHRARKCAAPVRVHVAEDSRVYKDLGLDRRCTLHDAILDRDEEAIQQMLLQSHGDVLEAKDDRGNTPLLVAVMKNSARLVQMLAQAGANVDVKNAQHTPALYLAAERGYRSIVEVLLQHKADPNKETATKKTALHSAATKGYLHIVRLLVDHGADLHHKAGRSQTKAVSMAKRAGRMTVYHYLQGTMDMDMDMDTSNTPLYKSTPKRGKSVCAAPTRHLQMKRRTSEETTSVPKRSKRTSMEKDADDISVPQKSTRAEATYVSYLFFLD